MATLRNLKYRDDQRIVDEEGNEVDLSNLDRNFSPMEDADTGEPVTNYKLQAYIDNPQLADIERDLALIKEGPGQETDLSKPPQQYDYSRTGDYESQQITKSETPEYKAYESKEARRKAEQPKIDAASQRLAAYASGNQGAAQPMPSMQPQPIRFDGTYADRRQFKQMIIDTKFAGLDPLTIDPIAKVEEMPISFYQQKYDERFANSYGDMPYWYDLDEKQRQAFITQQKAIEIKKAQSVQSVMANQMKDYLGDYEAQAAIHEAEQERERKTKKTRIDQYRKAHEDREKQRKADRKAIAELYEKRRKAVEQRQQSQYYPDQVKTLDSEIEAIDVAIAELAQAINNSRTQPLKPQGAEIKVNPGSRTRGKPDAEALKHYGDLAGLTRLVQMGVSKDDPRYIEAKKRALQWLEDAGFDTDPVPEGAVQKQKEQPAAPKEKQTPDLYQ
jgi:hypothetical protein